VLVTVDGLPKFALAAAAFSFEIRPREKSISISDAVKDDAAPAPTANEKAIVKPTTKANTDCVFFTLIPELYFVNLIKLTFAWV